MCILMNGMDLFPSKIFRSNILSWFNSFPTHYPTLLLHDVTTKGNSQERNPLNLFRSTNGLIYCSLKHWTFVVLWYVTMYKNIIVLRASYIGSLRRLKLDLQVRVVETSRIWGSDKKVLWGLCPTIAAASFPAQTWEAPLWHEDFTWSWFQQLRGG